MTVSGSSRAAGHQAAAEDDRTLGELLGDITTNLTTLVKKELDLAKTEAKAEAAKAGKGAGLLAGAGVTGQLALLFASLTLMFLLDTWMDVGWAALIVTVLWAIVAAVLAMQGRKEFRTMNPTLDTTRRTLEEDVQWARDEKNS